MTDLEREQTCHGGHPLCDSWCTYRMCVWWQHCVLLIRALPAWASTDEPIAAHIAARSGKLLNASSKIQFRNSNGVTREFACIDLIDCRCGIGAGKAENVSHEVSRWVIERSSW